jgi:VanZ family protein
MPRRRITAWIDTLRPGSSHLASKLLKPAALACLGALPFLSLTPSAYMVRTGADSRLEHVAGYAGSAIIVTTLYRERFGPLAIALLLIAYAGLLETGQLFVPGRHASLVDWGASSAGIIIGSALTAISLSRIAKEPATNRPGSGKRSEPVRPW